MKKKKFFILPILYCYLTVQAQTSSKNYLLEKQMLDAAGNQAITTVTYYDGLRYPVEKAPMNLEGMASLPMSTAIMNVAGAFGRDFLVASTSYFGTTMP